MRNSYKTKAFLLFSIVFLSACSPNETTPVDETPTTTLSAKKLDFYNDPDVDLPFSISDLMVPEIVSLNFELNDETVEFELLFRSDISFDYITGYSDFAKSVHAELRIWGCNSEQTPKGCINDTYALAPPYGPQLNPFSEHNQFKCDFIESIENTNSGILSSKCKLDRTSNRYEYYIVSSVSFWLGVFDYDSYPPRGELPDDFDVPQIVSYYFFPQRESAVFWDNSLPYETYTTGCFKNEFMSLELSGWAGIPNYDYFLNRLTGEKYSFKEGELVNSGGCRYMDERILINDKVINIREYLIIGFPYN